MVPDEDRGLSRREFMRGSGAIAGAAAMPAVLAACGGGTSSGTSASSGSRTGPPRRGGSLRVAYAGGSSSDTLDPMATPSEILQGYSYQMFEGLTVQTFDGDFAPNLAESVEGSADSRTWTIRLRQGIEFHDGRSLTADDVIFSLRRMVTLPTSTAVEFLQPLDPHHGLKKLDARTVRVTLKYPYSVFVPALGGDSVLIVPEGFSAHNPIGTGPFKYKSFSPGVEAVFTANRDWWGGFTRQTGGPYVDELRILTINDDNARLNALESGSVDAIEQVPATSAAILKSRSGVNLYVSKANSWRPFAMRIDVAPFNDVRVRQAMRLIANRKQLVDTAYAGYGRVANDLFSADDPLSIAGQLAQREQDIEQAKSLLRSAGQSDLRVQLTTSDIQGGIVEGSTVFASQAVQAGVKVSVNQVDPGTYYGSRYLTYPFCVDFFNAYRYLIMATQVEGPGAVFNTTHFHDAQWTSLLTKALGTQDETQLKELTREMQLIEWNRGGYIIWGYADTLDAASARVNGFKSHPSGHDFGRQSFYHLWLS